MTKSVVVGTAGHIDHGKSALVRALTGTDPDRLKEEQERGITIDLGFAHWQADDVNLAFVDVPGHERFVKNMLAGVGGIDLVLMVVAADESVMPQTREHFEICRLLRIPAGLVALTKADLVDADTLELVRLETRELVAGSFLEEAPIVPVSSKTGEGIHALGDALIALARRAGRRSVRGPVRLPIDRVFSVKGFGTVITGTLVSGELTLDDDVLILPSKRPVKVRGLQVHGSTQTRASAGQRVAANLGGVEVSEVGRGDTLVTPGAFEPTRVVDAVLELVPGARPLRHGARVRFHQGTGELFGRVALGARPASAPTPAGDGARAAQPGSIRSEVGPGEEAYVRLRLEAPAVVTRGDRYILRAYSPPVTLGGGRVLDPHPPRTGIRTATAAVRFARLNHPAASAGEQLESDDHAIAAMVEERGSGGLPASALTSRAAVPPADVEAVLERLARRQLAVRAGDVLVSPPELEALEQRLLGLLADHHRAEPLAEGMPREEARERVFARAGSGVFEHVLNGLAARGKIVARDRLALAGHHLALSPEEARARDAIERAFREAGLKPPDQAALVAALGVRRDVADRMIKLLLRQKALVRVDTLVFHEEALGRLKEEVAALKAALPVGEVRLDVATFKERYGISRKFAIPLLEYLDRERLTRRVGDSRIVI
jgi:selenocysteine-specific elongation factor